MDRHHRVVPDRAQRVRLGRAELDGRIDGKVSFQHEGHGLPATRAHPLLRHGAVTGAMLRTLPTERVMVMWPRSYGVPGSIRPPHRNPGRPSAKRRTSIWWARSRAHVGNCRLYWASSQSAASICGRDDGASPRAIRASRNAISGLATPLSRTISEASSSASSSHHPSGDAPRPSGREHGHIQRSYTSQALRKPRWRRRIPPLGTAAHSSGFNHRRPRP
jgi:hypothetical protein